MNKEKIRELFQEEIKKIKLECSEKLKKASHE